MVKKWENYEQVAKQLIDEFSEELGLQAVGGKQKIQGHLSRTTWEVDALAWKDQNNYLIVECKCYENKSVNQATVASLAWQIQDTGAVGGIIVTPKDLQSGAQLIAKAANIIDMKLPPDANQYEYMCEFLNKIHMGILDTVNINIIDYFVITQIDEDGNIVSTKEYHNNQ